MSLLEKIQADLRQALKDSDAAGRDTVRLLLAQLKNRAIELAKDMLDLADNEVIPVIKKEIKKRKDSIVAFSAGQRDDLVAKETKEIEILNKYVPMEMNEEEINKIIIAVVEELGGKEKVNFGQVMKVVVARTAGRSDNKLVSELVKKYLG